MTSGGLTMRQAQSLQKFTGRLTCGNTSQYDGSQPPGCMPVCEACLVKWLEVTAVKDSKGAKR